MAKFRLKKPFEVEAVRWTGTNLAEVGQLMGVAHPSVVNKKLRIQTVEGAIYASEGDWVVKGVQGCYSCGARDFESTYEQV